MPGGTRLLRIQSTLGSVPSQRLLQRLGSLGWPGLLKHSGWDLRRVRPSGGAVGGGMVVAIKTIITMILISIQPFNCKKIFALVATMVCLSSVSGFAQSMF